jgi:hypothetical protein
VSRDGRACVGFCNRSYRDAWNAHEAAVDEWLEAEHDQRGDPPAEPDEPCTLGDPVWCGRCAGAVRRALTQVDDLAALLDSWSDGHRGASSGETVSRRAADAGTPSPIAGTLDELYGDLVAMEDAWRTRRRYRPRPRRARNGHARALTVAWLLGQLDDILLTAESAEFGYRVLRWQRVLHKMTKTEPVARRRPGRCPRCGWVNVLQTRDDDITECSNCGRLMLEEEYQRDVLGAAGDDVVSESRAAAS